MKRFASARVVALCTAILGGLSFTPAAEAGTCGVPISIYFYQGVAVSGAPNGRVIVPARTDAGATVCAIGQHDAFFVEPGATFVISKLHSSVSTGPSFCTSGLGLNVCGTSRLIAGPTAGTNNAETEILPIDPTATGTITTTFLGHGTQSYRTLGS